MKPSRLIVTALCTALLTAAPAHPTGFGSTAPDDRWVVGNADGPAVEVELLSEDAAGVEVEVRLNWLKTRLGPDGRTFRLDGEGWAGGPGDPALPSLSRLLAAPGDAGAELEILAVDVAGRPGVQPAPQPAAASDRPDTMPVLAEPSAVFHAGQAWPAAWATLGESCLWQGRRVQPLDVFPLRWNPLTDQLDLLRSLRLRLQWRRGEERSPAPRQGCAEVAALLRGRLLNPDSPWLAEAARDAVTELPGRYLVVAPDAAAGGLEEWILWRRQQGYEVRLLLESGLGGQDATAPQIKAAIQEQFDAAPFDYLLLVGDVDRNPSGPEVDYNLMGDFIPGGQYADPGWSGHCNSQYCIVTDHPYALLEGTDYFADVLVGRFSVDTENDLRKMVHRTVEYDAHPFLDLGSQWYQRALMIYEVTGGLSRRETKLAIRDQLMQNLGYTQVDTILNRYWENPISPGVVTQRINSGLGLVNYRGYGFRYQWYGPFFGVDNIATLNNVGRWPLVTSIVCGGGDFASMDNDPSFGEAWLRAGATPSEPTGAVAFIGPSEEDTHTEWNNAIDEGIYQGLAGEGLRCMGALMDRGKLELWRVYPNARNWGTPGFNVPFYLHTYNLQGDPGLQLRTAPPRALLCDAPDTLALGARLLTMNAAAEDGLPLAGLRACLYQDEADLALNARADDAGRLLFDLGDLPDGLPAGRWTLTLYGPDLIPLQRSLEAGAPPSRLDLEAWSLAGEEPEDSLSRPGELLTLIPVLRENGATGFSLPRLLHLATPAGGAEILGEGVSLPATEPGQELVLTEGLAFQLADSLVQGEPVLLDLLLDGELLARLEVLPDLSAFEVLAAEGVTGDLEPGGETELRINLRALGLPAGPLQFGLGALHNSVTVPDGEGDPLELAPDSSAWVEGFRVAVDAAALRGSLATFELGIWGSGEAHPLLALLHFQLPLGVVAATDPLGPDEAGYLAWSSGDTGPHAPAAEWTSIASTGTEWVVFDWRDAWGENADGVSLALDLPFTFQYYGQGQVRATICTNGWLAFGDQTHIYTGINTPIPAAQGPSAMIAAYWTDLTNSAGGGQAYGHLYYQYRPELGDFVVEWNHFRPAGTNATVDVQLILRDPAIWPTATGDGEILLQLHDVTTSNGDNGVTVGLETPDEESGLQYAFNNQWAPAAQPITDGSALLFSPMADQNGVAGPARAGSPLLLSVHPNPFNPSTRLRLELAEPARVAWSLVNLLGQTVRRQDWQPRAAGLSTTTLDGADLASGVYLLTVEWRGASGRAGQRTEKLLLLR